MATGPEAWQRKLKEEKEREKAVKSKTAELHQNFRAQGLTEADTKLAALKQEERRKHQETIEMQRKFKKLEIGEEEKLLTNMKQEERKRLQETSQLYHTYQNNTIKESDMKLSQMRQAERKRMQEHEERLRQYQGNGGGLFGHREEMRRTDSEKNLRKSSDHEVSTTSWSQTSHHERVMPSKEELQAEIKGGSVEDTVAEITQADQNAARRRFRRSSIGTFSSAAWNAQKKEMAQSPPPPPVAQALENTRSNGSYSRFSKPLSYLSNDSPASDGLIADPIGQEDKDTSPTTDTPEPSERVETSDQQPTTPSMRLQSARSIFSKNTSASPLLPPKHNTYVASKSPDQKESLKPQEEIKVVQATEPMMPKAHPVRKQRAPGEKFSEDKELTPEEVQEEVQVEELMTTAASVVRLDVLFSFGLLTSSDRPVFTNYMTAVESIVKRTILNNATLGEYVWYDPVYPPFVQDYKTDDSYKDKSGRGKVRRLLVIAAIPIFLTNGISVKEAREGVCFGLQGAINSGEFIRLAKAALKKPE